MRKIIIKFGNEIYLKSKQVKKIFIKKLFNNIINILIKNNIFDKYIKINYFINNITIYTNIYNKYIIIINLLKKIPGIYSILLVNEYIIKNNSLYQIYLLISNIYNFNKFKNRTFCINLKKKNNKNISSLKIKSFLGYLILNKISSSKVKLNNPNIKINLELNNNKLFIIHKIYKGINGYPIGTQGTLLSFISGGYDSTLSSYMMIKKGCNVNFCYFDLFNYNNSIIKKIINIISYIYNKITIHYFKPKLYIINLSNIINIILKNNILSKYNTIIIKYLMFNIGKILLKLYKYNGIITGESLGQVSSQTIENLNLLNINKLLILRPLIAYDKIEIINYLRKLNLYNLCNKIPEYCGLYSYKATAKGNKYNLFNIIKKLNLNYEIKNIIKNISIVSILINKYNFNFKYYKKKNIEFIYSNNLNKFIKKNNLLLDITINGFYKKNINFKKYKIINIPYIKLNLFWNKLRLISYKKKILIFCKNKYIQELYINKFLNKNIYNIYKYYIK